MTNHRSEPDSAPGDDEPYECRGHIPFTRRTTADSAVERRRPVR